MFASRFFVSLLAFSALAVSANPAAEKRSADVSQVLAVINNLQIKTTPILLEIDAVVSSGFANENKLEPLVSSIISNLNIAHTSLSAIDAVDTSSGSASDIAEAVAPIVSDITSTLANAQTAVPGLTDLIPALLLDLSGLATILESAIPGL